MSKLIAVGVAVGVLGAHAVRSDARASGIQWAPYVMKLRSGGTRDAEIGSMKVPRMRTDRSGGMLTLRFVRLRSTASPAREPIIYLAGGPGSSGVEAALGDRSKLFDRLKEAGDVILLDQRGTGMSDAPPLCSKPWRWPSTEPATELAVNASMKRALELCASEWKSKGVDLRAFNSVDNAADVADLIHALGYEKARIVSISYGTYLGLILLRNYPGMVSRAAFAGTEGPDNTIKFPTQVDDVLRGLSRRLAAAKGYDLAAGFRRNFARLKDSPVTTKTADGSSQVVSLYDAQLVTAFLMATSENRDMLPQLFKDMDAGSYTSLASSALRLRKFYGALPGMAFATDAVSPTSWKTKARANALAAKSLFGNAANFPSGDFTGALGLKALPIRYTRPVRSNVPALFISGDLDWRTPPRNAELVRKGFTINGHIIVTGGGHDNDLFLGNPAIADRIVEFLGGAAPKDERLPFIAG